MPYPAVTIYWVEETRKYQCAGEGLIGIGQTMQDALARWLEDYKRLTAERSSRSVTNK